MTNKEQSGLELLYEIGMGTGAEISQLLELTVEDVEHQDYISMPVGPLYIVRTYVLPEAVKEQRNAYVDGRSGRLFINPDGSQITEEQAKEYLASNGITEPFLISVMRRYYNETGDIYYPMHMLQIPTAEEAEKIISPS